MALTGAGEFASVSAIVIGRDQESSLRINRFSIEGQVLNTLCLRMDHLTFAVVAGRLSDVDLVVHPVNDVEVVGAEAVPVDQRLRLYCWEVLLAGSIWLNCPAEHSSHSLTSFPLTFITTRVLG